MEDDRVIAKSIKQHIEAWGCSARTVRDFSDVMHEFAEFNPHLILMDIGLPFFDGYHWCSEIRKGFAGSGDFYLIRCGQYEYRYGREHGRR